MKLNNRRYTSQAQTQGEHQHRVCLHCGEDILGMGYPLDRQSCLYSTLTCPKAGSNYIFMPNSATEDNAWLNTREPWPISSGIENSYFQDRKDPKTLPNPDSFHLNSVPPKLEPEVEIRVQGTSMPWIPVGTLWNPGINPSGIPHLKFSVLCSQPSVYLSPATARF